MCPDSETAGYNASGTAVLRAAMPGAGDHDAAEDGVPAGPQVVVLPAVQRVHVPRGAAHRAPVAVLRVPVHAQAAHRARGARLPEQRAQKGDQAAGQAGVRGHVHDRGQRLGGRADIRSDHDRADIGECGPRGVYNKAGAFWATSSGRSEMSGHTDEKSVEFRVFLLNAYRLICEHSRRI